MIVAMSRRLAVLTLLVLAIAPVAQAANNGPVFGIRALGNPKLGYFVYSVAPGGTTHGAIIVSNTGNRAGTVKLYSADATTGRTTGTVYLTDKPPTHTGSWVHLATNSLRLRPGAHATVQFTVRVPASAAAGEWVSGLVAETRQASQAPKTTHKANVRIRIRNLTIVAVQVNVPGPRVVSFVVGSVATGGQKGFQQVIVHFANAGNVLLKPAGTLTILDSSHKLVEKLVYKMDTFLPKTGIDYPVLLKRALAPGDYSALVRVVVPGVPGAAGKTVLATRPFSVSKEDVKQVFTSTTPTQAPPTSSSKNNSTPWVVIGLVTLAVLALVALIIWFLLWLKRTASPEERAIRRSASAAAAVQAADAASRTDEPAAPPPPPAAAPPVPQAAPPPLAPLPPVPVAPPKVETAPPCDHLWEVAYDRGQLGGDGVWRFPHQCRTCGLELFATDIADASAQAKTDQ